MKIASGRQLEASKNMGNLTSPDLVVWDISEKSRNTRNEGSCFGPKGSSVKTMAVHGAQ